jgi:hypothetical protein
MAKKKKVDLVQCIYCKYCTTIQGGELICTTKYQGEKITDYSRVTEDTKVSCSFYRSKV